MCMFHFLWPHFYLSNLVTLLCMSVPSQWSQICLSQYWNGNGYQWHYLGIRADDVVLSSDWFWCITNYVVHLHRFLWLIFIVLFFRFWFSLSKLFCMIIQFLWSFEVCIVFCARIRSCQDLMIVFEADGTSIVSNYLTNDGFCKMMTKHLGDVMPKVIPMKDKWVLRWNLHYSHCPSASFSPSSSPSLVTGLAWTILPAITCILRLYVGPIIVFGSPVVSSPLKKWALVLTYYEYCVGTHIILLEKGS